MTKSLENIKLELKELIPVSMEETFEKLVEYLDQESIYYNKVLQLKGMFTKTSEDESLGLQSQQTSEIEYNRIRKGLLNLIDDIRAVDIGIKNSIKKGEILYNIPPQMTHLKATPCIVRIAQRTEFLLQDLELEHQPEIESIKISKVMIVELMDITQQFEITSIHSAEQYIEDDSFTEWKFYVKPLQVGSHPLLLKVTTIQLINNKERKKEIVLERMVEVVTTSVPIFAKPELEKTEEVLVFANGEQRTDPLVEREYKPPTKAGGPVMPPPSASINNSSDHEENIQHEVDTRDFERGKEVINQELEKGKKQIKKEVSRAKQRAKRFVSRIGLYSVLAILYIKFIMKKDVTEVLGQLWEYLTLLLQSSG